jgi:hypothetical protein
MELFAQQPMSFSQWVQVAGRWGIVCGPSESVGIEKTYVENFVGNSGFISPPFRGLICV